MELELEGTAPITEAARPQLRRLMRSARVLGALAAVYCVLPSLLPADTASAASLRILCASGALLGAIPSLWPARRRQGAVRAAMLLSGSVVGAILAVLVIAFALGEWPELSEFLSWAFLFPALSYGAAVMFLLLALDAVVPDRDVVGTTAALLLAAFGVVPLANALTATRAAAWYPIVGEYWLLGGGILCCVLLTVGRWLPAWTDRLTAALARGAMRLSSRSFLAIAALFVCAASAALAVWCFGRQPHNADEVAQLWHARILLSGHLSLPAEPNPEFFGMDNVIDTGRWYSQFPIGGPAFLALGMLAHAAWLVNPLLLALTLVNIHRFARAAYDEPTARASALVFALSPFVLFMGASFMNHVPVLWLVSVALRQLSTWVDADERPAAFRAAALIGLALGAALAVRPLDAVLVAVVIGAMQLFRLRDSAVRRQSLLVQCVAGAFPVALLLIANARTTGSPFRFGYEVMYGAAHGLGFHADPYGTAHTPLRALMFASKYLLQLDATLLQAPLPAVGIIVAGLFLLHRSSRWDRLLLALLGTQLVGYALYWHEGDFRGPRFLFTAMPAIVILLARAPFVVARATHGATRRAALLILPLCLFSAWFTTGAVSSVPAQVRGYRGAPESGRVDPDSLVHQAKVHHALVFVSESFASRATRRLWALGIPHGDAMRLLASVHPCVLRTALEDESRRAGTPAQRLQRILHAGDHVQTPGEASQACIDDLTNGGDGAASFAPFFSANTIGPDGRLGGDVIYALDQRARDEVLRARFGDRTWYRFGPHESRGDSVPRLTPYVAPAR